MNPVNIRRGSLVPFLFPVREFVQSGGQKGEGACEKNVAAWGNTTIRDEATLAGLCVRELP